MGFTVNERIPLVFIFPEGRHAGRIGENVQNLDIGPTILDYMGLERPEWMGGLSLLSGGLPADRFIFTIDRVHGEEIGDKAHLQLDQRSIGPPFYSLGSVGVFYCDRLYNLRLEENLLEISRVAGHTAPCAGEDDIPDSQRVIGLIIDRLIEDGYDVSSIKTPVPVRALN